MLDRFGIPAQALNAQTQSRDLRLDLARGLALWFVYLDHIPNNICQWLTLKNYGFSDTTELFFFVSGYSCALAYGAVLRGSGFLSSLAHGVRRALDIYGAFLLLVFLFGALVFALSRTNGALLDETNMRIFFSSPGEGMINTALLYYMPVNTDVLPTFALLHLVSPLVVWLMMRSMALTLAASLALYVAVHLFDFDLPTWQHNGWFFNPFAWQLLFVAGAWAAMGGAKQIGSLLRTRIAMALAILYLLFSFYVVMGWHIHPLEATIPDIVKKLIYPIDKSYLDPLRVLHFASLVVVVYNLVPHDWRWFDFPLSTAAIRCGEQALIVYCVGGVPLAFLVGEFLKRWSGGIAMQIAVSALGIAFLVALATLVTASDKAAKQRPNLF